VVQGSSQGPQRSGQFTDRAVEVSVTRPMGQALAENDRRGMQYPPSEPTRSVAWCSASIWSGPDGSGLLTLDGSSVQTDPDRSRRIVWMIRRMIKRLGRCLAIRGATSAQDTRF
jgi:hypothetical protein